METYVALTTNRLEEACWTRISIRRFQDSDVKATLFQSLQQSDFKVGNGKPKDLRWACLFTDEQGHRVLSIYLDKFGGGQINDRSIKCNGKILCFLRSKFAIR